MTPWVRLRLLVLAAGLLGGCEVRPARGPSAGFPGGTKTPRPETSTAPRLLLGGGDTLPEGFFQLFREMAGGDDARVLLIPWATQSDYAVPRARAALGLPHHAVPHHALMTAPSASAMKTVAGRARFREQLTAATGVFFLSGQQARYLEVLQDPAVAQALTDHARGGVVFAGTSAGSMLLGDPMITGTVEPRDGRDRHEFRPGLGLAVGTVIDTHFLGRERLARLREVVLAAGPSPVSGPRAGVGVDGGSFVLIEGHTLHTFGPSPTTILTWDPRGTLVTLTLPPGRTHALPTAP